MEQAAGQAPRSAVGMKRALKHPAMLWFAVSELLV